MYRVLIGSSMDTVCCYGVWWQTVCAGMCCRLFGSVCVCVCVCVCTCACARARVRVLLQILRQNYVDRVISKLLLILLLVYVLLSVLHLFIYFPIGLSQVYFLVQYFFQYDFVRKRMHSLPRRLNDTVIELIFFFAVLRQTTNRQIRNGHIRSPSSTLAEWHKIMCTNFK